MNLVYIFLLLLQAEHGICHLCLITPRQRGDMDISMSGSHTCSRHVPECGGQSPENPKMQLTAGEPFFFKWQQNYNHYELGYPGYMDLSIAPDDNSTDYTLLAVVADQYAYAQDHQQNYTAIVTIPVDIQCEHCTLRARYNAHKPGETIFYQCSDVTVMRTGPLKDHTLHPLHFKTSDKQTTPLRKAADFISKRRSRAATHRQVAGDTLYGVAFNPLDSTKSHYISIDSITGRTAMVRQLDYGIDSGIVRKNVDRDVGLKRKGTNEDDEFYVVDGIIAVDNEHGTSNFMLHNGGGMDAPSRHLLSLNSTTGFPNQFREVLENKTDSPITWLSPYMNGKYLAFSIEENEQSKGSFYFTVGTLGMMEDYKKLITTNKSENLYVNFQWMEKDALQDRVYALIGNENSPDALLAKLYTFDISSRTIVKIVDLDVSTYTFMSVHSFSASGVSYLMALSPGLFGTKYPEWTLVRINPNTGNVTKVCEITPAGMFEGYYGGSVFSGVNKSGMFYLYHVFRVADTQADVIAKIDLLTCNVEFSQLTNLRHIHYLHHVVGNV